MKNGLRCLKRRLMDMPISKKIIVLYAAAGLLPLSAAFFIFYQDLQKSTLEKQQYAMNQNYDQTYQSLLEQTSKMNEIMSMIVINEGINEALKDGKAMLPQNEQIRIFKEVERYTRSMVKTSNLSEISYFIDESYLLAGSGEGKIFRILDQELEQGWYTDLMKSPTNRLWTIGQRGGELGKPELRLYKALWSVENFQKIVGIVSLKLDDSLIENLLKPSFREQKLFLCGQDMEQRIGTAGSGVQLSSLKGNPVNQGFRMDPGKSFYYRMEPVGDTGLLFVSIVSGRSINAEAKVMGTRLVMVFILINLILAVLIIQLSKLLTKGITSLDISMERVQQGEFEPVPAYGAKDEVGRLIENYNYMIREINYLLEQQFKTGQEKKSLELKALQSQINPHFLYNTLELISWMAVKNETKNIQLLVRQLSNYYKLVLNRGEDIVTIEHEISLCMNYMEIQMSRFKGRIDFSIQVDDEIKEALIPKIVLQPILENAIFHGINKRPEGRGTIAVRGTMKEGRILLTVWDDGIGFLVGAEALEHKGGSQYGVKNIEERLNLFFYQDESIKMESTLGVGTCVTIDIPYRKG